MATRLGGGDEVVLDPESSRFTWSDAEGAPPTRMRWFLREGWGDGAHYDAGPVLMRAPAATVLLPVLAPADWRCGCAWRLRRRWPWLSPSTATASGSWRVGPEETEQSFRIPARYLVRGDNLVTLTSPEASLGARLLEIRYRRPAA